MDRIAQIINRVQCIEDRLNRIEGLIEQRSDDAWLSLKEAAEFSNLSVPSLRRLIYKGRLKASRKTGKVLIRKSLLDKFLGS